MQVFLDESGDLGWKFELPYGAGGSSRFLTLAFLIVDETNHKYPRRLVKRFKVHYGMKITREIKGCDLTPNQRIHFAKNVDELLSSITGIEITARTVMKKNVQDHIREDSNKLYNYMINSSEGTHTPAAWAPQ